MPRFAANLSLLFSEAGFPARFERAAEAGFEAGECLFPYEWEAREQAEWLQAHMVWNMC